ncbi:MAG: hypothetical protein PHT69_03085 [Bacteroidales bacterium]|nr:hypothetical protein [Bacteroidales bacterium]
MKKTFLVLFTMSLIGLSSYAQKVEVLYFKADLACCAARACANLEGQVKAVVEENFNNRDVVFKSIRIADPENAALIEKYSARSQTVIIRSLKRRSVNFTDATTMVRDFSRSQDQEAFKQSFLSAIRALL